MTFKQCFKYSRYKLIIIYLYIHIETIYTTYINKSICVSVFSIWAHICYERCYRAIKKIKVEKKIELLKLCGKSFLIIDY